MAEDEELAAILFLSQHPAWTWADLNTTPDDVVAALKLIDQERANARR